MPASSPRDFAPTPAQLRFLDYVHAHPGFSTIAELCAACGVDPSSYYKWCHDPAFKQWLTAEWSSRLLFEGWHFLNLARANCTNSATHFRVLMNLLFDPKGQAALTAWQQSITPVPPTPTQGSAPVNAVDAQGPSSQSNPPANSSFSAFSAPAPARPNPGMTAKHLSVNLARLQRQPVQDASPHPRPPAVPRHRPRPRPACRAWGNPPVEAAWRRHDQSGRALPTIEARPPATNGSDPIKSGEPLNAHADLPSPPAALAPAPPPAPGGDEPSPPPLTAVALLPQLARIFSGESPFALPLVHARLRCARLMLHAFELVTLEERLARLEQACTISPDQG